MNKDFVPYIEFKQTKFVLEFFSKLLSIYSNKKSDQLC